jgi:DNA invertase Pin-like site-specific DNA recombinase
MPTRREKDRIERERETRKQSKKLIAYYRVSTEGQGRSGLGLAAQKADVAAYSKANGCTVIGEYCDIESGTMNDRPKLQEALSQAKLTWSTLCIAKLDRLSRNSAFLIQLQRSEVPFVCCDNPHATRFILDVMAAFAEDEARRISQRTKDALAARRAKGLPLGAQNPNSRNLNADNARHGAKRSAESKAKAAREYYIAVMPKLLDWHADGLSAEKMASELNEQGISLMNGNRWTPQQVYRVLERYGSSVHSDA